MSGGNLDESECGDDDNDDDDHIDNIAQGTSHQKLFFRFQGAGFLCNIAVELSF